MLRAVVIAPQAQLRREFELAVETASNLYLARSLDHYPGEDELADLARSTHARVAFVDLFSSKEEGLAVAARSSKAGIFTVALHRFRDPFLLTELMQAGIREYLWPPFEPRMVSEAIERIRKAADEAEPEHESTPGFLCGFLPAKPGSGATTLAVQAALALGRLPEAQPLLLDFDLAAGATHFLLGLRAGYGTHEALERAAELARDSDDTLWRELVSAHGRLAVLSSSAARLRYRFEPTHTRFLLEFARRHYAQVFIDLPGSFDDPSIEVLQQCQRILLVLAPDLPSVHMARERLSLLSRLDLAPRVSLLVNRWTRTSLVTLTEIERALGQSVEQVFAEDSKALHAAILGARGVDPASDLGRECGRLAEWLIGAPSEPPPPRWRFLEYITTLPDRYTRLR